MKIRRACCCSGCSLALLILAIPTYLFLTPPKPPPPLPPAERAKVDARVTEVRNQVKQITRDASAGKRPAFTLTLREAEINRLLETDDRIQRLMHGKQVSKAWVRIVDGRIRATAIRSAGTPASFTVNVAPEVSADHTLSFRIEGVDVGRLGMPNVDTFRAAAQKAVSLLNDKSMIPDAKFDAVKVEDGSITLTGKSK